VRARWIAILAVVAACGDGDKRVTPPATIVLELKPAVAVWYNASPPTYSSPAALAAGLVIGLNNDSDGPGTDSNDNVVNGANDAKQMTSFIIKQRTATAASGDKMHLQKGGGGGNVRVFRAGNSSAGIFDSSNTTTPMSDADATALMNDLASGDVELYVEGTAVGDIQLCAVWSGSASSSKCANLYVVDGHGAASGYGPRIYGNTNRNATLAADDIPGHDTYTATAGAITFTNLDDDCAGVDDQHDTTIGCAPDEADIAHFRVAKARMALGSLPVGTTWKPVLRYVVAGSDRFRVFDGITNGANELPATPLAPAMVYKQLDLTTLSAWTSATDELTLGLEGRKFDVPADPPIDLFVCLTDTATQTDAACDRMVFRTNNGLLQPNSERDVQVVVLDHPLNAAMRTTMTATMPAGAALNALTNGPPTDQWYQDQVEIVGIRAPRGDAQLAIDLPRTALAGWSASLIGPDLAYLDLTGAALKDSPQFGGNLECSPPAGGGQGRMIVGDDMLSGLITELQRVAPAQTVVALPVGWLMVGHVDEVAGVFPKTGGWGTTVGDPNLAKSVLAGVLPKAALFWHCRTPGRTRAAECYGEGVATGASHKAGATPARLEASGFTFTRPIGREFQWIRIYAGTGRGQIARIAATSAHAVDVVAVALLPGVAWTRCADSVFGGGTTGCDPGIPGLPTSVADFGKETWFTLPDTTSRFVVVEDSLRWDKGLPALVTAGELRDSAVNPEFWGRNHDRVVEKLTGPDASSAANVLAGLPGGSPPVRLPVLYSVFVTGPGDGTLVPRKGDALIPNLTNYQVVTGTSGTVIYAPKPWGPSTGGTDPFETKFRAQMASAAATIEFVDDWDAYHIKGGEVHCATNLFKASARKWWQP
jgi:hypothetical protein